MCDLVELPFRIKFSFSRKLSGYEFPAISKQRHGWQKYLTEIGKKHIFE